MIEFVHESDYSSEHHCEVHERETNQKPRVASDFCNHATNRLGLVSVHIKHAHCTRTGKKQTWATINIKNWVLHPSFSGKVHYYSPEKVIADKVFCDFNSVADIQFGNA